MATTQNSQSSDLILLKLTEFLVEIVATFYCIEVYTEILIQWIGVYGIALKGLTMNS